MLQEGEEDEPLIRREGWGEVVSTNANDECSFFFFLLDHTNYFEWFSDWLFLMLKFLRLVVAFLYFFCHANAKLASEHWTIIVIENIANSRFLSSTLESRMCLLS